MNQGGAPPARLSKNLNPESCACQHGSLRLSAALLGAILVNGFAYNEAKKAAKGVESTLKDKLDATEAHQRRLEQEIHRYVRCLWLGPASAGRWLRWVGVARHAEGRTGHC